MKFQGTTLFYEGEYRESIPYLGCAFDITAILLEVEEGQNPQLIEKVFALSTLIGDAYRCAWPGGISGGNATPGCRLW